MKKLLAIPAILIMTVLILCAVPVAAATSGGTVIPDEPVITVSSSVPLLINGILTTTMPVTVSSGTQVSVVSTVYYTSQGERWTFQSWSDGSVSPTITLTTSGTYIARFSHEVLLQVSSNVYDQQQSKWLTADVPYRLTAPAVIPLNDNERYSFQSWSDGETPYQTGNIIAPFKALNITLTYVKEYLFTIKAPDGISIIGSGWYTDGTSLVIQAPQDVYDTIGTTRQDFDSWESVGYPVMVVPSPKNAVTTVKIDGAYTLEANYNRQFKVVASSPFGKLTDSWVNENAEQQLEAPATVDIIPDQERFVFQRWTGMEGLVSPKVSGLITQPVQLNAVYEHQYMVTLNPADTGSGSGWYKAGSVASITMPSSIQKGLFITSRFGGFTGYSGSASTMQVVVDGPLTITANYSTGLDLRVLAIIIVVVLVIAAGVIWVVRRRAN